MGMPVYVIARTGQIIAGKTGYYSDGGVLPAFLLNPGLITSNHEV